MKILVTGSAGFIGSALTIFLLKRGDEVFGVDNLNDYYDPDLKKARLTQLEKYKNFEFKKTDICDLASMDTIFDNFKPEKVVNLAAQAGVRYSLENPQAYIQTNVMGFMNVLELCKKHKVSGLIYASSSSVYGGNKKLPFSENDSVDKPISIYAASKKSNELMAHSYSHLYGLNTTGLRFFTVYGPWGRPDMALYIFSEKIAKGETIQVYNHGNMVRDFTYVEDIIQGTRASIEKNYDCEVFNLGNNRCEELMGMIKIIETKLGVKANIEFKGLQMGDVEKTFAEIERSKAMLGYSPKTTISEGIPKFIDWFQNYHSMR